VTAVELMPVHRFLQDHHLVEKGLRNYWGYNTLAFLAPHDDYSSTGHLGAVQEFKTMVKTLHAAGIEVILDVVYNHTAEGNHLGPTLSMRGLDNHAYYRLMDDDRRYYRDFTGTGNSMNVRHPHVLQLIMDSLRYWVTEMHVDGFRFDLASALARELLEVDRLAAFFDLIQQDPVVSRVKLIAEPWDIGEGGYQVGNFPALWSEWNGRYRDTVRDFWRSQPASLGEFGSRFTGSSDLYQSDTRRPTASINFVTCHDGFTMADLVSHNEKHNEANGEDGRDGESHNRSWNCGVEGPTDDPAVNELRRRQRRNMMLTLLLSQGVPMLLGGDELGRTQQGNNNAYCQDNALSWYDWESADEDLVAFCRRIVRFRRDHPVFRRRRWFHGRPIRGIDDMAWFRPDGAEMSEHDWTDVPTLAIGVFLNGQAIAQPDRFGRRVSDDTFLLLFNAHHEPVPWKLPSRRWGTSWVTEIDTAAPDGRARSIGAGRTLGRTPHSIVVLRKRLPHPSIGGLTGGRNR
jgi:isoamylase